MKARKLFPSKSPVLICYIVPGYPSYDESLELTKMLIKGGVDAIEIGVPFSDPIADGKTIQRASYYALKNGINIIKVLEFAESIRNDFDLPLYIMSYLNPILKFGMKNFAKRLSDISINGSIIVDLPIDYFDEWYNLSNEYELETVLLCSPSTDNLRIKLIDEKATGFIYLVSVYGITGIRETYPKYTYDFIRRIRNETNKPLVVGFGVSKALHAKSFIECGVNGVVMGSAILNFLEMHDKNSIDKILDLVKEIKESLLLAHKL